MISLIIPLYNTPIEYFQRCIESILKQEYEAWEIIIIDDGSEKVLSKQYRQLCNRYEKMRYYWQENQGVSVARNIGINFAEGEYTAFIDGDDKISTDFLKSAVDIIEKDNPDFIVGMIESIPRNPNWVIPKDKQKIKLSGSEIIDLKKSFLGISQNKIPFRVLGSPCGRLYKTSIVKKNNFPEGIAYYEDQIFNRGFMERIQSCVLITDVWYYYYQNNFSAMHTAFSMNRVECLKPFWRLWLDNDLKEKDPELKKNLMINNINFYYTVIHEQILEMDSKWDIKRKLMSELIKEDIFVQLIKDVDLKAISNRKDRIRFFAMSKNMFLFMYLSVKVKVMLEKKKIKK